jgi:hypothetical protein
MKRFCLTMTVAVLCFLCSHAKAQTAAQAAQHPAIMKYYTLAQLENLEQLDTAELNSVVYYFTKSFIVEPIQCTECLPFDSASFDITKYEYLRQADQTYIRTFDKYGFKLILFPVSAMPYYYAIQHVPKVDPGETDQTH